MENIKLLEFDEIKVGEIAKHSFHFTQEKVAIFSELVQDFAPVHCQEDFAKEQGFSKRIVHGFFVSSIFSGMLGTQIPGPKTVINTCNFKMHNPVLIGDQVDYEIKVASTSNAVKVIVLELKATNQKGEIILSGKSMCSFPSKISHGKN